jgi:hypothetical protein
VAAGAEGAGLTARAASAGIADLRASQQEGALIVGVPPAGWQQGIELREAQSGPQAPNDAPGSPARRARIRTQAMRVRRSSFTDTVYGGFPNFALYPSHSL